MVLDRWHSYSTLASSSLETYPHQKSNRESPHTFIFRSRDLLSWHQARQVAVSRLSKDSSTSLAVRNISIFTRSLEEGGSSGHNMPVAYKQGQLISTLFTPASYPEYRLGPTVPLPPVQPVQGTAHRQYPGNKIPGAEMVRDDWEAYMWQMSTGQGEPDPSCCNKERSTRIITRLLQIHLDWLPAQGTGTLWLTLSI